MSLGLNKYILEIFHQIYSTNDNNILHRINDYLDSIEINFDFFTCLFQIIGNPSIEINTRKMALIQFRVILQRKKSLISKEIKAFVVENYISFLTNFSLEIEFKKLITSLTDEIIDISNNFIKWEKIIIEMKNNIGGIILLNSYLHQQKEFIDCNFLQTIFLFLIDMIPDNSVIEIILNIFKNSLNYIKLDDNASLRLFNIICSINKYNYLSKIISIHCKLFDNQQFYLDSIVDIINSFLEKLNDSKIAIKFFHLFSIVTKNLTIMNYFESSLINIFSPFFCLNLDINEIDPYHFICDFQIDSFSSNTDPKSAAFHCVETISKNNPLLSMKMFQYFTNELNKEGITPSFIYSIFLFISAIFKNIPLDIQISFCDYIFELLSDNCLINAGILLILAFESNWEPNKNHVLYCFDLISKGNEICQYFSILCLSKLLNSITDEKTKIALRKDDIVLKSFDPIVEVSKKYGIPQFIDIISYFMNDSYFLNQFVELTPNLVCSSFNLLTFYNNFSPDSISISSIINTIMSLVEMMSKLKDFEFYLCKLIFNNVNQFFSEINYSLLPSILELLVVVSFYSPCFFNDMLNCFSFLIPILNEISPISFENTMILFSNIISKKTDIINNIEIQKLLKNIIDDFLISETGLLVAIIIKHMKITNEIMEILAMKIVELFLDDEPNIFTNLVDLIFIIFQFDSSLFIKHLGDYFLNFIIDLLSSCSPHEILLVFPLISQFLPKDIFNDYFSVILNINTNNILYNTFDEETYENSFAQIKKIPCFNFKDIVNDFLTFLNNYCDMEEFNNNINDFIKIIKETIKYFTD